MPAAGGGHQALYAGGVRVAAIQTTAGPDRAENLAAAGELVDEAVDAGATLVAVPEYFSVAGSPDQLLAEAEDLEGPTVSWAAERAARHGIWLLAGSFPERAAAVAPRVHNTSCLLAPDGSLAAVYRKIHLFDAPAVSSRESVAIAPGDRTAAAALDRERPGEDGTPVLGLSLCFDLRFPELYRALADAGATIVAAPSAFTAHTGPAHWELLVRARAVENEVFVIAPAQVGELPAGMPPCHGHTMIVDPWGTVLDEVASPAPGVAVADLDLAAQQRLRAALPVLDARRPSAYG